MAFVELATILPAALPSIFLFNLTKTVVLANVPLTGTSCILLMYVPFALVDNSYPVAAVNVTLATKLAPETVKLCDAEALFTQLLNELSVPDTVITAEVILAVSPVG